MKPLVSVIVPLYNASQYICEALESIVASSYRPIEVIVMDDGSKDDSLAVARAFAKYCGPIPSPAELASRA